jgi:hypothetical protein
VYVYVRYEGDNDLLSELDRRSKLNEAILRFQTIVLDHPYVQPVGAVQESAAEATTEAVTEAVTAEGDESAAVEAPAADAAAPATEKA